MPSWPARFRTWEQRLAPLAEAVPPITPSPRLWRTIALRLGIEPPVPATDGPWWSRLAFWRGLALASLTAALALGVTLLSPGPQRADQPIVVVLAGPDAKPALLATVSRRFPRVGQDGGRRAGAPRQIARTVDAFPTVPHRGRWA